MKTFVPGYQNISSSGEKLEVSMSKKIKSVTSDFQALRSELKKKKKPKVQPSFFKPTLRFLDV